MADAPTSSAPAPAASPQPSAPSKEEEKPHTGPADAPAKSETESAAVKPSEDATEEKNPSTTEPSTTATQDEPKTDVADTGASASAVAETAPETVAESNVAEPVTPATGKKSNGNPSTKKKSAGVPEHKSKKLNKKKSKAELHLDCEPGQLFLARMKGHAPWPSIICDEEILPASLLNSRPVTTAQADGTFKRADYAPGGKRQGERTYPVMFLYTNEFAWLPNTDLTPITPEECKNVEEKGKAKGLIAAYGVAAEGHDLQHFKTMLAEHQAAVQEDLDRQAEKEAEKEAAKAAKAAKGAEKKNRRKSAPAPEEDEDEDAMDVDEEGESSKPKSKKRKKAADAEDETEEKPAKTPKLKLNGPKTPSTDKKAPAKSKSSTKKAPAKKDSDEEMEDAPAAEAAPLSAAEIKEKKEKEIRYYRHKLQRGLLSRDDPPSEKEVSDASGYLGKLETYEGLEGDIIRSTKIHKVLRAMLRLTSIPKEEEFNLRKRSNELLQKWQTILGNDGGDAEGHTEAKIATESAESDKKTESADKIPEPSTSASEEPKADTVEDKKADDAAEAKVNGTTEKPVDAPKADAPKPTETTSEQPKSTSAELTNGVEKPTQPEVPAAEAPKTEAKPEESSAKPVEASS